MPYRRFALPLVLGAFLAARVAVLHGGSVRTSWDAFSYAYRDDPHANPGPLVSFTGNAPRLWGVPAFFALFHTDGQRVVAQWALGTVAWALLACALWTVLRSPAARLVGAGAVLFLAVLTPVTEWDFTIMSESLSVSVGVIVLACLLFWLRHRSRTALVGLCVAGVWWTFTRPEIRLFTAILAASLAVVAWRRRELRRGAIAAVAVLAAAIGWCSAIIPNSDKHFRPYALSGLSYQEDLFAFKLRWIYRTPPAEAVYENQLGMPPCPGARSVVVNHSGGFLLFMERYRNCPALVEWGRAKGSDTLEFVRAAPDVVAGQIWDALPGAFGGRDSFGRYGGVTPVVPAAVEGGVFHPTRLGVAGLFGALGLAVLGGLAARRRRRLLVHTALVIVAAGLVSEVIGIAAAATEVTRYSVQEDMAVRIGLVVLVAAALDAYVERHRDRAGEGTRTPTSSRTPGPKPDAAASYATPAGSREV
jgi:hypothetical protein